MNPIPFTLLQPLLKVRDLAASVAFYREVLGFTVAGEWPCGEAATRWLTLVGSPGGWLLLPHQLP